MFTHFFNPVAQIPGTIIIYTHGLAVMMMHDSYRLPKEDAFKMVYDVGEKLLHSIGIDKIST